jgi:tetratricopeptide (TPR) repeat protein
MNTSSLYKNLLVVLAAGSILGSCSKSFVDKTPTNNIPTEEALNSVTALQSSLNGTYAEIRNFDQFGRDWPILGDLMADNIFVESNNSGRYIPQWGYYTPVTDAVPQDMWAESYTGILRCNQIIDANVPGADEIKAQATGVRALLYFKMVTTWGANYTKDTSSLGVPLVLHYDVSALPKRSSVGTVYNQIVTDLTTAMNAAPDYDPGIGSIVISKWSAEAILARVYMYMGQYQKALDAANDVINQGPFSLVKYNAFVGFWGNPAPNKDATETIFEVDADAVNNNGFDDLGGFYYNGYQDVYATSDLVALYAPTDIRNNWFMPGKAKNKNDVNIVIKFPNALNNDKDNLKVIRLSEVYLIAAESANRLGDDGTATDMVNAVAEIRDTAFHGYTSTGTALLNDIITERRKELACEGDRLYDMNRLSLQIVRISQPGAVTNGDGITIDVTEPRRLLPIPQSEILRNPNIAGQQNPGY